LLSHFHFFAFSLALTLSCTLHVYAAERTWRTVQELSLHERKNLDLSTQSSRGPQHSHLPKEKIPFTAQYSAEEMGIRAMGFPHTPPWNCLLIDIGTTVTADGFLDQQVGTSAILSLPHPGSSSQELFRWISQSMNSQDPEDTAVVQVGYHTGNSNDAALTTFFPRPGLPPLRSSISRGERLPRGIGTIEDVVGRNVTDFSWRILGSEMLDRTIRFPATQEQLVVPDAEGRAVNAFDTDSEDDGRGVSWLHHTKDD